ncbi:hypothetical protein EDD17DRAFT_1509548 [Pisolithus thermaeus]|nr:hypothetical protein EDD17DRAFT_1509548 [Pisolithus thermaeus]
MITLDTYSSSQSSLDIDMPKQFEAILQKVCRSINVDPDDVDYRICRRGFQYISGADRVKQMEVFTRVGLNEFQVISAIAKDISLVFLKLSQVLIVKMPSTLHEAPLDELKTVLERRLDCLPSHPGQSVVHATAHMNCLIRFNNSCSCTCPHGDPSSTLYLASACVGMRGRLAYYLDICVHYLCQLVLASNCWPGGIWSMPASAGWPDK